MQQKDDSPWEATSVQNLFRYRPSGTYFARFKVGGKPIRQSLETTVFSVAKQRLPDKMREHRTLNDSARSLVNGKMTVGEAAQVFLTKVDANVSLKPRTKAYYRMLFDFIKSSWPTLAEYTPCGLPARLRDQSDQSTSGPSSPRGYLRRR